MTRRRPYPSDLSDARWELIEPTLTAWRRQRLERGIGIKTPTHDLRDVMNAFLYLDRTGMAWAYLPHDFPPHTTVYTYHAVWRDEGLFAQLGYTLTGMARAKEGRAPEPTAAIIDTQSVKTSTNAPWKLKGLMQQN